MENMDRPILVYDNAYCVGLIKACFKSTGKNILINKSKIKKLILQKVEKIEDNYGLDREDQCSDIIFNFLSKSKIMKIDNDKGSPTTFILQYVFNQLRNIEAKLRRNTYYCKEEDIMNKINNVAGIIDNESIIEIMMEGVDFNNPESLMMQKEMVEALYKTFTISEVESIASGNNLSKELQSKLKNFKAEWLNN